MLLVIPQTVNACQLEFPEDIKRSVKGSLHLRPGSMEVTEDEWAHIKKKHPALASQLQPMAAPAPAPAPVPAPMDEATPEKLEDAEPTPEAKPAKRK